jgi:curved DNA-binding protein CbpA
MRPMPKSSFDPYATLGVSPTADAGQVQAAYRRLARRHHPDLSTDGASTERMQRINQAWDILSDPGRKARYDADAALARSTSAGHWSAPRRQSTWAPPPPVWSGGAAAMPRYGPQSTAFESDGGPSWPTVVTAIVAVLIIGPLLLIAFPIPFVGLLALLVLRFVTARFDD